MCILKSNVYHTQYVESFLQHLLVLPNGSEAKGCEWRAGPILGAFHSSGTLAKADPFALLAYTKTTEGDSISILEERATFAAIELDNPLAALAQLKQTTALFWHRSTDGSRSQKVTFPQRASSQSMVGDHLRERPHEILSVGLGNGGCVAVRS